MIWLFAGSRGRPLSCEDFAFAGGACKLEKIEKFVLEIAAMVHDAPARTIFQWDHVNLKIVKGDPGVNTHFTGTMLPWEFQDTIVKFCSSRIPDNRRCEQLTIFWELLLVP